VAALAKGIGNNAHMRGDSTVILGIEIPSTDPIFIAVIVGIHVPLGLACVVAGAVAMLSEKRRGRHSTVGKVYYWCLFVLFRWLLPLVVSRRNPDHRPRPPVAPTGAETKFALNQTAPLANMLDNPRHFVRMTSVA
jgi:hypothetical protein